MPVVCMSSPSRALRMLPRAKCECWVCWVRGRGVGMVGRIALRVVSGGGLLGVGPKGWRPPRGGAKAPGSNRGVPQAAGRPAGALRAVRWPGGIGDYLCPVQRLGTGLQRGGLLLPVMPSLVSRLTGQTLLPESQSSQGWYTYPCPPSTATPPFSSDWLPNWVVGLWGGL